MAPLFCFIDRAEFIILPAFLSGKRLEKVRRDEVKEAMMV